MSQGQNNVSISGGTAASDLLAPTSPAPPHGPHTHTPVRLVRHGARKVGPKVVGHLPAHVDRGRGVIDASLHVVKRLALVFAVDKKPHDAPLLDLFSCVLIFVLGQGGLWSARRMGEEEGEEEEDWSGNDVRMK